MCHPLHSLYSDPHDPSLLVRDDLLSSQNDTTQIADTATVPISVAKTLAKAFARRPCLVSGVVGLTRAVKQRLLNDKLAVSV